MLARVSRSVSYAAVQAMINAEPLSPADQIAQYEAAYETLRETLASIDQA
jgi:hypothetical protein